MEIIGHQKQIKFLQKMAKSGKIPHALLFSGQDCLGKKTIALHFISQLFGENPLFHPDFILIEPIKKQIQIDQIRELSRRLSLKPMKAPLKTAIIDKAHSMNEEAQNCFLKTLEEPRGNTLLILITEYPNFLLPTIISRCEMIKFYPVETKEIRKFLSEKKILKEETEKIVGFSLGRPGQVFDFLENPEKLKEQETKIKELIKICNSPLFKRFQYAKELSVNESLKEILNIWLIYFREALISQKNVAKIKNILKVLQRVIFLMSTTNINQRLALEILMLEF
jgi:DNA polymerase-3 subunit delta'